jgi:hypothetical protein
MGPTDPRATTHLERVSRPLRQPDPTSCGTIGPVVAAHDVDVAHARDGEPVMGRAGGPSSPRSLHPPGGTAPRERSAGISAKRLTGREPAEPAVPRDDLPATHGAPRAARRPRPNDGLGVLEAGAMTRNGQHLRFASAMASPRHHPVEG